MKYYPVYPYYGKKTKCEEQLLAFPPQHQEHPGLEYVMNPRPIYENPSYMGSQKLQDQVAIVTGGDSGIGRAVSIAFAKEGADIVFVYLNEHRDAEETKTKIEEIGRRCLALPADLRYKNNGMQVVDQTVKTFGKLDTLVNNIGVAYPQENITDISEEQLISTFATNIFSFFFMTQAAMPYLMPGSSIINTASAAAYDGEKNLIDYSSTKGAVVSFTRALSKSIVEKGIRVNAVAPSYTWTPLITTAFYGDQLTTLGTNTPMKRAAQPFELAPTYVYLASQDSQYVTGQTLHVNGGYVTSS
ncbi:SDR family oxidoreductase [Bacillus sp. BRMEA1]|uniref:SDR family oxidoreductase n=1 Tax=Neobacillus endophyticus TaxID=2738405 RepID=UPI00156658FD|nr:SDR family oxidoreductase [Neobacillus endophyticus]NRD76817.1 SDR family oxidoreductase [Neobacillus endophyticus]